MAHPFPVGDKSCEARERISSSLFTEKDFVVTSNIGCQGSFRPIVWISVLIPFFLTSSGCNALLFRIKGSIPASELSDSLRPPTRNHRVPIDYRLLGQATPSVYRLDSGDVLGIAIEGILPYAAPSSPPAPLPVNFPTEESRLPPSTGFPMVVQENGTILLPGVAPIMVRGKTLDEVRELVGEASIKNGKSGRGELYPMISLLKQRTYSVSVIRRDLGSTSSASIRLDAYRNDVLNALLKTGGLPGPNAKDEVTILPQIRSAALEVDPKNLYAQDSDGYHEPAFEEPRTIALTQYAAPLDKLTREYLVTPVYGSILNEGDIIYIESRESEVFYTAGMLPGGQHPIPRDYDIDIFEAMAIAGYSYGHAGSGGGGLMGITGVAPTQLFVFRKNDHCDEITIKIDLVKAIRDPRERLIVKPGDKLLLRFSPKEEVANFTLISFFTFGFQYILNGNNRY